MCNNYNNNSNFIKAILYCRKRGSISNSLHGTYITLILKPSEKRKKKENLLSEKDINEILENRCGTLLVVQWLRLCTPNAGPQ